MESQASEEIKSRRFEKELKMLEQLPQEYQVQETGSPFGIIIKVTTPQKVTFSLHLEGRFPFQSPKVLCDTVTSFPSFADGRDLLYSVIKSKWSPSITTLDLIQALPEFLEETKSSDVGEFHLGHPMLLDTWEAKSGMKAFYAIEMDPQDIKYAKEVRVVVTHTVILQLEVTHQYEGVGYLTSWATLNSLSTIKRSKSDPQKLTFEWKAIGEDLPYSQVFKMPGATECVKLIGVNMKKLGTAVRGQGITESFIKEEEVKPENTTKLNIWDTLRSITHTEEDIRINATLKDVEKLVHLYQTAIEYFSAMNDPQYDEFLGRLHSLLSDEKVTKVLEKKDSSPEDLANYEQL